MTLKLKIILKSILSKKLKNLKQNLKIGNSHKLIGTRLGGEILLFFRSKEGVVFMEHLIS